MSELKRAFPTAVNLLHTSEPQGVNSRVTALFSLVTLEGLATIDQGLLAKDSTRLERQINREANPYQVYEQHVGILSPTGAIEDYYSSRQNGSSLVALARSAEHTSFRELTTDELQSCGGIGFIIGTPETGQWKILAHARAIPASLNALLAIAIKRALDQGACLQQRLQIQFETAGSSEIHHQMIAQFLDATGIHADIKFVGTNSQWALEANESKELTI